MLKETPLVSGMHNFSINLRTMSKFWAPEWWHTVSSILGAHKLLGARGTTFSHSSDLAPVFFVTLVFTVFTTVVWF
jgi:hypothetical protein